MAVKYEVQQYLGVKCYLRERLQQIDGNLLQSLELYKRISSQTQNPKGQLQNLPQYLRDKKIEPCLALNQKLRAVTSRKQEQNRDRQGQIKLKPRMAE